MSTSTPGPRRRRIAGERKSTRPQAAEHGVEPDSPPQDPVASRPRGSAPAQDRGGQDRGGQDRGGEGPVATATTPARASAPDSDRRGRGPRRAAPRRLLVGLTVAATVLVLAAAAVALLVDGAGWDDWQRVRQQDEVEQAIRTAPAAAERAASAVLAYDYRKLEADRDAAAALMTPEYRKEYLKTFELVMEAAPQRKARVEADVRASGVSVPGADRVEVLLFVNQTTVSTANSGEPQTALNRVVFTMERDGDAWRVDDITSY